MTGFGVSRYPRIFFITTLEAELTIHQRRGRRDRSRIHVRS